MEDLREPTKKCCDTAFARYLCRSRLLRGLSLTTNLLRKKKTKKTKKRILALLYLRQAILPEYWILDIEQPNNRTIEIQPIALLSRLKTLSQSSGIDLCLEESQSQGDIGYKKGTIQADRFISLRLVYQCASLCPRSHSPSCLAYFPLSGLGSFEYLLAAGICILWTIPTTGNDDSCQSRLIASPSRYCSSVC